jgi:hypothetical protein
MSEIDSVDSLTRFQWFDPLSNLCEQYVQDNRFTYAILGYSTYFEYLSVIWVRFVTEFKQYDDYEEEQTKLTPKSSGTHVWSSRERELYYLQRTLLIQLQLDYESFVVFMRVLMNKIARIAQLLIGDILPPHASFYDQKKYFVKHRNGYNDLGKKYEVLVREKTNWFENSLRVSRDKIMIHGDTPWVGIRRSPKRGLQFMRAKIIGTDLTEASNAMQSLKDQYKGRYPQLNNVVDNLWEITEFIMINNVRLSPQDRIKFEDSS